MNRFNTFAHRVLGKSLFGAAMLACALAGLAGAGPDLAPPAALAGGAELPTDWQGRPLRPLALSRVEQRFAERFPGRIARLTDGRQIVVLRNSVLVALAGSGPGASEAVHQGVGLVVLAAVVGVIAWGMARPERA